MIFLQPWHGAIAAAIVVPAVLLLYVLRLRRRPLRVSSSLFWPTATDDSQVNEPFKRLRFSWMLLLHLLIVLLLCAAMARPASSGAAGEADRVILLVDLSASMDARDGPGSDTRLDLAKVRARQIVDELMRGSRRSAAVMTFGATPEIREPFTTSGPALRAAIAGLEQTDETGDFTGALRMARAIFAASFEEGGEASTVSVVLFSDGGVATDTEQLAGIDLRFERIGPVGDEPPPLNVGITAVSFRRDTFDPSKVRVFGEFVANRFEAIEVPVSVAVSGSIVGRRIISLTPEGVGEPARASATFEINARAEALVTLSLERKDALDADNLASVFVPSPRTAPIVVVHADTSSVYNDSALWLLTEALAELPGASLEIIPLSEYVRRAGAGMLRAESITIFNSVGAEPLPPGPSISFGTPPALPGLQLQEKSISIAEGASYFWPRRHPFLQNLTLDALLVSKALPSMITESSADGVNSPRWTELLRGGPGPMLLLSEWRGVKRVMTTFELANSNWLMLPAFAIFLADTCAALSDQGAHAERGWLSPGAYATVNLASPSVIFSGPQDVVAARREGEREGTLGPLRRAGVYLAPIDAASPHAVAVNVASPQETLLPSPASLRGSDREIEAGSTLREMREHWPLLLLLAALLLMAEWVLFARGARV